MSRYRVRDGIVLRRTPLPSGDVVATLLSGDGKWRAVARKGRLLGGNPGRLSLFHDVRVQVYQRRPDDLAIAVQVHLNGALPRLSLPSVYPYAHLLAELADRLTVDVHLGEPLHAWLASGLRGLGQDEDPERVALVHAWRLLRIAGLAPSLAEAPAGAAVRWDVPEGTMTAGGEGVPVSAEEAEELRLLLAGGAREALASPMATRARQWRLLRMHVDHHVERLRSLDALVRGGADGAKRP